MREASIAVDGRYRVGAACGHTFGPVVTGTKPAKPRLVPSTRYAIFVQHDTGFGLRIVADPRRRLSAFLLVMLLRRGELTCHCLLVESDEGLVLIAEARIPPRDDRDTSDREAGLLS
jgi:hypothetical protein